MYPLGEQFQINYDKILANEKSILKGRKYRITVLTERLVRLEFSEEGLFEDRPTKIVLNRNFSVPLFTVREDQNFLEITTKYFKLSYAKERPFLGTKMNPMQNLKIELLNTEFVWYYKEEEVRNYGAPKFNLLSEKGKLEYTKGLYSSAGFASMDDSSSPIFEPTGTLIPREKKETDVYVFLYHKDFSQCLHDYFSLTGNAALLPRFAFGNWWSRDISYNESSVVQLVDDFEKNEIPLSILVLSESDWHKNAYEKKQNILSGFTFDPEKFPNPAMLTQYLHSKGIRLGVSVNPTQGFYPYEQYYEMASQYLKKDQNGILPFHALDPRCIDVYFKLFIHPLDALGIDFYYLKEIPTNDLDTLWVLNHYHFYDLSRDYKRRPLLLTTNSLVAPHRYPVLYSGKTLVSWETLKQIPLHNASAMNLGVAFWSHDIGGYYKGIEDNELYTRFVQLGTFSPILKFGSTKGKYYKREPWKWGVKTYEIVKTYLKLRHRLIPYLYTEAYLYAKEGHLFIKPIYYDYPEFYDDVLYKREYYLGSEFFIAPIVSKKDHVMNRVIHRMYIPKGTWYDFVTGKKFPGDKKYVAFFKDNEYPVFVKEGSILVLGDNENLNDTTPPKNIEIQIFPGCSSSYNLYEDDGLSDLYKKGFYLKTNIDYNYMPNNYTVIVRAIEGKSGIVPEKRNYKFNFRNTKKSDQVSVYFNSSQIAFTSYVEKDSFVVEVKDVPSIGQLTINCKGKDIEISSLRIINDDIKSIISDLQIETELKELIDDIMFCDLPINKKRIEIRKLARKGLEKKFVTLFLKLLEYLNIV